MRWLLLITLLGGLIRFTMLASPSIWGDEANTYARTASDYDHTVELMEHDGFAPLHYELYFVINHFTKLTPTMLRLTPAICGTLQIPAIYFLARQLVRKKTALLAALFTACSAYMIVYSRDAKMYMELWFFATLHLAGFLWWLRTNRRIAWLVWITAGVAMGGVHAPGLLLLGLEPLMLLTQPRPHWSRTLFFLLGVAVIAAGPGIFYLNTPGWNRGAIGWVEWRNEGQTPPDLIADTLSAYLFGWNFIQEIPHGDVPMEAYRAAGIAFTIILILLLLGTIPYPRLRRKRPLEPTEVPPPTPAAVGAAAILDLFRPKPKPAVFTQQVDDSPPVSWWYAAFWIGLWIIVPTYGFYCASFDDAAWPTEWLSNPITLSALIAFLAISVCAWIFAPESASNRGKQSVILLLVAAGVLAVCCIVRIALDSRLGGSVWMPRYLGIVFPALTIAVAVLLMRLPTRPFRYLAIAFVLGVNLLRGGQRIFAHNEPPVDRVADDVWASQNSATTRTYAPEPIHGIGSPATGTLENNVGLYYLYMHRTGNGEPDYAVEMRLRPQSEWEIERNASESHILRDVQRMPELNRIIIWENAERSVDADAFATTLGEGWKLKSEETIPVRMFWTWAHLYDYQRREYVKDGSNDGKSPAIRINRRRKT